MTERTIYEGKPSQLLNLTYYIICFILLPLGGISLIFALIRFLKTKYTYVSITNERVIIRTGILSRQTEETELYRIKDFKLFEPFFLRLFKLSNLVLYSSDRSSRMIYINGIENGHALRNHLRNAVETCRGRKRVSEHDISY